MYRIWEVEETSPDWVLCANTALELARADRWDEAGITVNIFDRTWPGVMAEALMSWIDYLGIINGAFKAAADGRSLDFTYKAVESGAVTKDGAEVPDLVDLGARMFQARWAWDQTSYDALLRSVVEQGKEFWAEFVGTTLSTISINLNRLDAPHCPTLEY